MEGIVVFNQRSTHSSGNNLKRAYIVREGIAEKERRRKMKIIVDSNCVEAEEFASWLIGQGYNAEVAPAGRHSSGRDNVEGWDGDEEELLRQLWEQYCTELPD